jgi:protein-S-isoprenylcysteine O-methyltransferase Ste14
MTKIIWLILGWILYFAIHSLLADRGIKQKIKEVMDEKFKYYRLMYVAIASAGLIILFFFNASMDSPDFFDSSGWVRYLSLMFAAFGVIIIKITFRSYHFSSFVGMTPELSQPLITSGLLGSVRHPIYSGTILIAIGFWLFSPDLPTSVSVACIFAYLPVGIHLEEKKLIAEFGEQYLEYKKEIPAIFPRLF